MILGRIMVTGHHYGERFNGTINPETNLPESVLAAQKVT
jgi:hypothetical protein